MRYILIIFLFLQTFLFGVDIPQPLSEDKAFDVKINQEGELLKASVKLGKNIYLYENKIKIKILKPKKVDITKEIKLPTSVKLHKYMVIKKDFVLDIPISLIKSKIEGDEYKIELTIQGCAEDFGICYRPKKSIFATNSFKEVKIEEKKTKWGVKEPQKKVELKVEIKKEPLKSNNISKQDSIANVLKNANLITILGTFFMLGLLLSLTPCIFPMIPILSSIIVSQGEKNMSAKKGFFLSLVYVLSMSITYTIAGILAGKFGNNLQATFQNQWVIVGFATIFVILAFSMFGYYDIEMPQSIQNKLNKKSDDAKGKGVIGVAIMGFLSALIVGPCVAAPLAGALIYIGQTGDAFLGGVALFTLSIGMGMPLLLIGIGAGKYMPRPGVWMEITKAVFGVVMLGIAIWMLSRVLDPIYIMYMWSLLFISSGIYMGVLEPEPEEASGIIRFFKVIAYIMLLYGTLLFIGAINGSTNPTKPLESFNSNNKIEIQSIKFKKINSIKELQENIDNSTKPIMIDFYATWCTSCIELEDVTFKDSSVINRLQSYTLLKADVSNMSKEHKDLMKKFAISGPPSIVFYKNKKELKNYQLVGYIPPKEFISHLDKILAK